ncbi:hypothetical protein IFR04_015024 [Cadophora malorum]|uniref:RTA1 like protein n=1 Tax=Cadophora malorum TaxID=108018 RepID=A0A8H7SZS4_9HELO|nr:hypothetical protein IFR04_015024 [Cadophora malorum]
MATEFKFYHYDPSLVGAIIFTVAFLVTTSLHSYQLLQTRTWFMIPLVVGGFCPYLMQTLLLLVAPALFAASIYMALSRIILLVDGESLALIKKKWLTKLFVGGDITSFLLQAGGGGIQASGTANALTTGSHLVVGGLFVQLFFFGCFIAVAVHFDIVMHKLPTSRAQGAVPWRKHLLALYAASVLIMIRSVFRVIEYLQGFSGYLLSHEVYLYIFDAVLMLCVMLIFNVVHPSEVMALLKGGKAAKRGWKMEKIVGYHQRVSSQNSGKGIA